MFVILLDICPHRRRDSYEDLTFWAEIYDYSQIGLPWFSPDQLPAGVMQTFISRIFAFLRANQEIIRSRCRSTAAQAMSASASDDDINWRVCHCP